ncbi:Ig-like domain-containing protein [Treponema sp.]|uniref:Ig-like domain-containing protein n=1 Tax=Treponema sp. TaxID=166 RepID=UPI0025F0C17C|nr:Ig-like domain-containing protein [Treponema sp.]MBR4323486.1 Ig domain-containing protein [Treponema sp.]
MKHIQKLRKLILALGILAGMNLTANAIPPESGTTGTIPTGTIPTGTIPTEGVSGISLDLSAVSLSVGGTETLTATVSPDGATDKTVTWSSDNTSVATVDANGKVTAASAGTANITATATNGTDDTSDDKQATCTVTVTAQTAPAETLLTTITPTSTTSYRESTEGVVNVTLSGIRSWSQARGWTNTGTVTVTQKEGYTITKCRFNARGEAVDDTEAPFSIDVHSASYVSSIDVYGYATGPNKSALNEAITAAETLYNSIKDVEDYSTIASTLKPAIDAAKEVANSDTAAQNDVDAATTAITTAKTNAEAAIAAQRAAEQPVTVAAKADPSTTGTYYATFYDSTTSYTADCEVYYATANADGRLTLEKAEGNVIKAGEGVILKATGENVTLTKTTTEASYDSLLTGSNTETSVENALVLSLGKNGVWFYKYSGTLGANKAYLAQ